MKRFSRFIRDAVRSLYRAPLRVPLAPPLYGSLRACPSTRPDRLKHDGPAKLHFAYSGTFAPPGTGTALQWLCVVAVLLLTLLAGCASQPVKPTVPLNPAATIATLTSSVALSVQAGEKGLSGRGYLIMRAPDQFRLVILSPFGTTVAEMFLAGEELLYVASSQNLAYQGLMADLPNAPALQGWRLLRWTTERVVPETPGQTQLLRLRGDGEWETIEFDPQGLVLKKRSAGDVVRYEGYQSVDGVPVPTTIEIVDRYGITVRITLDEPEVNVPLDDKAFVPALDGVKILPLSQFPTS